MPPPPGEVLVISLKTGFSLSFSFGYGITDFVHNQTKFLSAIMPLLIVHAIYLRVWDLSWPFSGIGGLGSGRNCFDVFQLNIKSTAFIGEMKSFYVLWMQQILINGVLFSPICVTFVIPLFWFTHILQTFYCTVVILWFVFRFDL